MDNSHFTIWINNNNIHNSFCCIVDATKKTHSEQNRKSKNKNK